MSIFTPQNPGIGGLDELTGAEELFVQNLAGLSYAQGDVLYHDGSDLNRLPAGTNGQFLKTQGAGADPVWATIAGGGDVSKVGTPVDNQVGVWTGDGTIEGDANLIWTGTALGINDPAPVDKLCIIVDDTDNVQGLLITQNDTTNNPRVFRLNQNTDGDGFVLDQNGTGRTAFFDQDVVNTNWSKDGLSYNGNATVNDAGTYTKSGTALDVIQMVTETSGSITDSSRVANFVQSNTSATGDVVFMDNSGMGSALFVSQDGTLNANNRALEVRQNSDMSNSGTNGLFAYSNIAHTVDNGLTRFWNDNASAINKVLEIRQDGTGVGVFIDQNGNATGLSIDSEATTSPAIIADIVAGDAHLRLTGDSGNATPTEGDLWRESDGLKYFDGSSEINLIAQASTIVSGQIEIATIAETNTGTDATRAVSPDGLDGWTGSAQVVTVGTLSSGNATAVVDASSVTVAGKVELATTAEIDTGTDSTRAMPVDQFVASKRNIRWLVFNLVEAGTDVAVATNIAGDFVSPIAGTILQSDTTPFFLYATNSTAGVTGTTVVDISIGGTSIMTTNKLDFDTTEKTTTTAATPPDLTTTALAVGDIITIDVDSIATTAPKGLTVYMAVREG